MCCPKEHEAAKVDCHDTTTVPKMNKQWDASSEETEKKKRVEKCQSFFVLALKAERRKVF
jgi:hypothetical protein